VKFHSTRLSRTDFVVPVVVLILVLVPLSNSDFEDEDEDEDKDEKNQIRSPANALTPEIRNLNHSVWKILSPEQTR